jgi:hypothetical protein
MDPCSEENATGGGRQGLGVLVVSLGHQAHGRIRKPAFELDGARVVAAPDREEEPDVCGGWGAPPAMGSSDGGERAGADRMGIEEDARSEGGRLVREISA